MAPMSGKPMFNADFIKTIYEEKMFFDFSAFDKINYDYVEKMLHKFPEFELDEKTKEHYIDKLYRNASITGEWAMNCNTAKLSPEENSNETNLRHRS